VLRPLELELFVGQDGDLRRGNRIVELAGIYGWLVDVDVRGSLCRLGWWSWLRIDHNNLQWRQRQLLLWIGLECR